MSAGEYRSEVYKVKEIDLTSPPQNCEITELVVVKAAVSVRPKFFSVPHAIYIAGYVIIEYQDVEIKDQCGEVLRIQRQWNREYNAGEYDLVFDPRPDQNPARACTLGDHAGALNWASALKDAYPHYKYLGRIKPGLSSSDIITESNMVLANMGKYSQIRNNCFTFVKKIYADEAA